ncbi:E3 ubiquitin-protein ligase HERC2-like, partial [Phalaenopsis equestris]|uniref:E3 ubiquitin-protein ligase HERC2-like n=1 Tax=Phalaenopsis equestris TaxID=78828 RepID=UPI0009E2655E
MHPRTSFGDGNRHSVSNAPSCSSHTSGPDDIESLGDVYVWGEVWSDEILPDGHTKSFDALLPKPLESNFVINVHQIACGFRHAALVSRQGEVFTWGEECGGRLGHGTDIDRSRPRLVESLALFNVDSVACGEYHTCAITTTGDLFTWGDGAHNTGLLGHGSDACHWLPKRVSGPLEGLQVSRVACGTWHTALAASNGKLYTFGDGSFGVLGHGDRESVVYPREIRSLSGLRAIGVACGVWHTAAIVEVMGHVDANIVSQKLFTWGDGEEYRLGHGDKEAKLVPTCVASIIDYNFRQLACGHNITVALSTCGHVFTMGSSMHGELGNPQFDGKVPCLVQDRLVGELAEEIACGSHHVVVLTARSEVYTWGRGANGRLGHGDTDDRRTPVLVEALKDRHVKSISCGSNLTACICIHKWVSSADQSVCTGCRQAFGFTRKRHNCYNCGLVFCHACSSRKVLKAVLAPSPEKPHRVCDSCYSKLKAAETGRSLTISRKHVVSRQAVDSTEKFEKGGARYSRLLLAHRELRSYNDGRYGKNKRTSNRTLKFSSGSQLNNVGSPHSSLSLLQSVSRPILTPIAPTRPPAAIARFVTPYSWKPNSSLAADADYSGSLMETLKTTNEHWDREVSKLQEQVRSLEQKLAQQDAVAHKASKEAKEAASVAAQESAKFNVAFDLIKTIKAQMKDMAEKLPDDLNGNLKSMINSAESFLKNSETQASNLASIATSSNPENQIDELHSTEGNAPNNIKSDIHPIGEAASSQGIESSSSSPRTSTRKVNSRGEVQLLEQFEPGVYVNGLQLPNGTLVFKRIKFSKRRFTEGEAEEWWRKNQE